MSSARPSRPKMKTGISEGTTRKIKTRQIGGLGPSFFVLRSDLKPVNDRRHAPVRYEAKGAYWLSGTCLWRFLLILNRWGFPRARFFDSVSIRRIVACRHRCHRIPAALQSRFAPDRTSSLKTEGTFAQARGKTLHRSLRRHLRYLWHVTQDECWNFLKNSGYAST